MSELVSPIHENRPQWRIGRGATYSARIQEVMRYDRLNSSHYPLVMTILNAISEGYSQERWKEEQQRMVKALTHQSPEQRIAHADATNRYEQTVACLKDLMLWPWE